MLDYNRRPENAGEDSIGKLCLVIKSQLLTPLIQVSEARLQKYSELAEAAKKDKLDYLQCKNHMPRAS